jgi:hypothetical protein
MDDGLQELRCLSWSRVDADALDCVAVNVAVLLDFLGIADVRTPFAAEWHFAFEPANEAAHLRLTRSSLMEAVRRYCGCIIEPHAVTLGETTADELSRLAARGPFLVFGDAYHMPWLPYVGHQHMEHSVIVAGAGDDDMRIVDAYVIRTEWGDSQPIATSVPACILIDSMKALVSERRGIAWTIRRTNPVPQIDLMAILGDNVDEIVRALAQRHALRSFARHYQERSGELAALRDFTLNCWLVARARQLHARWLQDRARDCPDLVSTEFAENFDTAVVRPWQKTSEFAYISLRRRQSGRLPPDAVFGMIIDQMEPAELEAAKRLSRCCLANRSLQRVAGPAVPC